MSNWRVRIAQAIVAISLVTAGGAALANSAQVYYKPAATWTNVDIHYGVNGTWTVSPGVAMTVACAGWVTKTIDLGTATTWQATFNNTAGAWDNNAGKNYTLGTGIVTVNAGVIGTANPCDFVPPIAPPALRASNITASSVLLSWDPSTDNVGIGGYDVYRNNVKVGSTTGTSYTDSGLASSTGYTYKVIARDTSGNVSAFSPTIFVITLAGNAAQVYYKPASGWAVVDIHYSVSGVWTVAPGVPMSAACTGWFTKTIDLGNQTSLVVTFNNGSGTWDSNGGKNYTLAAGTSSVNAGVVAATNPCGIAENQPPTVPVGLTSTTITSSSIGLSWTASTDNVGVTGYDIYRNNAKVGTSTTTTYTDTGLTPSTAYSYTVDAFDAAANVSAKSSPPLTVTTLPAPVNNATVYYYTGTKAWPSVNIHYGINGTWTTSPGVAMNETACTNWVKKTVALGSATSMKADFNNGSTWDNNGGLDYTLAAGVTTVKDGAVTSNAVVPCVIDTTAPTPPTGLAGIATNTRIALTWTASTDNVGVTSYSITRTGGTQGTVTLIASTNSYTDSGLDAQTSYTYSVKALDAAGNTSTASTSTTVKTGDAAVIAAGSPLGGDPREDAIYFVMTARFYDGDTSNNVGGIAHISSGNAANNDPMFRGDFKGLMQKLDYIKALGFSAIWITPVVLNRNDYDFHGYHGWDFYVVDPRLESAGASYQDLINAAHAKGIKIIQDVVYNHSTRWGAKGLWTGKFFGVQDAQWGSYYDTLNPSFTYNGLTPEPNSHKTYYNGDLWASTQPTGNTCKNWGLVTGTNPSGQKIYGCQWPDPTSAQFPPQFFHQCWLGNWEDETAKSCWIAGDLADFNTENTQVQNYLINAYNKYIEMGVDGFRIDTAIHIHRVMWNRHFLPAAHQHAVDVFGSKGQNFFTFGEVAAFVNDKWNHNSPNHSMQFYTWKERTTYSADDAQAVHDQYNFEQAQGVANQPTSSNAFLNGNLYHTPDHSQASGMAVIDMRMHMNFGDAHNAFANGKDTDDSNNDATYNVVYVESHDYGPSKSSTAYAGGTAAWAENMSLMWTFRGIPTLYQGSEIEFQAGKTIDCGPTCPLATTRRAYYGAHLEGSVTASDFGVVQSASGEVANTLNNPLVKHVQRLNQIRRKIPALQKGQYSTADISGNDLAYKRRFTDATTGVDSFVLVTVSNGATFSNIPNGTYTDAVTGDVKVVSNGVLSASASGQGNARIYVLSLPGNPAPGKIGVDGPFLKP